MSSQRTREERILERLQTGALVLARPSDTVEPTAIHVARCHGCLEPETDAQVGDRAWHRLCALFWQGRSESFRAERIQHTQPGVDISPARPRWVIVVPLGGPETYAALRRRFARSPWVDVVIDRPRGERRQDTGPTPPVERRIAPRRRTVPLEAELDPGAKPAFRLAHRNDEWELYESTGPESGPCSKCGVLVSVELPRFVEPPIRRHEPTLAGVDHVVDLPSFSATGRVLLATSRCKSDR